MNRVNLEPPDKPATPGPWAKPAGVNLFQQISGAIDHAAEQAIDRGLTLVIDLDPQLRAPRIESEAAGEAIERLLRTVAGAAVEGTALHLKAHVHGDQVCLLIGARIMPGQKPNLSTQAQAAIALAGGRMETMVQQDGRTVWRLSLPAPLAARAVLVIDDDRIARLSLIDSLRTAGFACEAVGGEDGQMRLAAGPGYAAVLIDLWLEDADPLDLAGLARGPAFALSDRPASSRWALLQAGFQGLLQKPLSAQQLKTALG